MRIRYEHALRFDAFSRFIETITQQRFNMASNVAYYVISIHIILSGIISHMGVTLICMIVWIYEIGLCAFALAFASYISMFVHLFFVRYILYSMLQVTYCTEIQFYYSN